MEEAGPAVAAWKLVFSVSGYAEADARRHGPG